MADPVKSPELSVKNLALAFARANKHGDPEGYASRVVESFATGKPPAEDFVVPEVESEPPAA